jgi:hypothetical protein
MSFWEWVGLGVAAVLGALAALSRQYKIGPWLKENAPVEPVEVETTPEPPAPPIEPLKPPEPPETRFLWDTVANAKHSVRLICDEEGLTWEEKNDLCATMGAESGWQSYYLKDVYSNKGTLLHKKGDPVIRENYKDGKVWSTDWGICQINDYFHIKAGTILSSPQQVLDNPEICIRWACKRWREGKSYWWIAYKSGAYRAYL